MTNETANPYRDVLEDLARSRGLSGAEELGQRAAELDPGHTAQEYLEEPPIGFGTKVDRLLNLSDREKVRLSEGFRVTFLERARSGE